MPTPPIRCIAGLLLRGLSGLALAGAAHAQIAMDGTLGAAGALAGPNFAITSSLGRQFGANLFHSFSTFNIASGQSATFSGPGSVSNIIGWAVGAGRGAALNLSGANVTTNQGSNVITESYGSGAAGAINLSATGAVEVNSTPFDRAFTNVATTAFSDGDAGPIRISGDTVTIKSANVYSATDAAGNTGQVLLQGRDVNIVDGGWVYTFEP